MSGEFERIDRWFLPLEDPAPVPPVLLGNGDDALALAATDRAMVISVDTLVEGTHVLPATPPGRMAVRALRSALSDLAAMGARPWFYTLSLVIPRQWREEDWQNLSAALHEENHRWRCPCVGGDTTQGPCFVMTVQVHGLCDWREGPVTRSGLAPGDDIWLLGTVGDAAGGLARLRQGEPSNLAEQRLVDAFYEPPLWFSALPTLMPHMTAAIDVSDGLVADARHLTEASVVALELYLDALPISPELLAAEGPERALELALGGGEDYALLFGSAAAASDHLSRLEGVPLTRIGRVSSGSGLRLLQQGKTVTIKGEGYDHFR